jgi:hypothetical protein
MGLFTRRTLAGERSVAEIEADLEHYRERHALYLLTIRALLYYIKEFSLDLTETEADRFKECMDTLAGHFLGEEKPSRLQSILADYKDIILAYRHWFRLLQINLCSAFKPLFESRRSHGARSHVPESLKPLPGLDGS